MAKRQGRANRKQTSIRGHFYRLGEPLLGFDYQGFMEEKEFQQLLTRLVSFTFSPSATGDTDLITCRRETRQDSSKFYWYAYRTVEKKTYKVYVGSGEDITYQHLKDVVKKMNDKIKTALETPKTPKP